MLDYNLHLCVSAQKVFCRHDKCKCVVYLLCVFLFVFNMSNNLYYGNKESALEVISGLPVSLQ